VSAVARRGGDGDLFAAATDFHALIAAARRAARGKRPSREALRFLCDLEPEVLALQRELRDGTYRPRPYHTFRITDPKPRTISAAAFRDRVVHHALCAAMEPALERYAIEDSYACRPGKGVHAAVRRAQRFARSHAWVLKLDVLHFYETADHDVLKALLRERFTGARLLALADLFIDAGAPGSPPGKGLPIGNLTSQHFANLYLTPLDRYVKQALRARGYVRYMDDHPLFADAREAAWRLHAEVETFLRERLRVALREDVTRLAPVTEGIAFLGFRIWPRLVRLDGRRVRRFRGAVRRVYALAGAGHLDEDAAQRRLASHFGHAAQADTAALRRSFVARLTSAGAPTLDAPLSAVT
jgi:hypothetical protein